MQKPTHLSLIAHDQCGVWCGLCVWSVWCGLCVWSVWCGLCVWSVWCGLCVWSVWCACVSGVLVV